MADQGAEPREVVYCHLCENEWHRDEHGLKCPQCESEFVEVIEQDQDQDPRHNHVEEFFEPPSPPLRSLHDHNPWGEEAPDPDEGNIDHVEWHGPGMHFSRTSYRSPQPGRGRQPQIPNDFIGSILGQVMAAAQPNFRSDVDRRGGPNRPSSTRSSSNTYDHTWEDRHGPRFPITSPLQEGPGRQGNERTFTPRATARLQTPGPNGPQTHEIPVDDFHGIMNHMMATLGGAVVVGGPNPNGAPNPFTLLTQLLNPTNARHGDAVYTQEALDRVITQLMEQHNTSSAPGPASPAAIAALPKTKIDQSMLGSDGKAECSVCMDNVSVGDEVTTLPCNHWFHGDCVGAWLKEHDTCPHCRQSITPKEGTADAPRTPGQAPRHSSNPSETGEGSGSRQHLFRAHGSSSPPGPSARRPPEGRRPSSQRGESRGGGGGGAGDGGGLTGWVSRHFGGGGNGH